MKLILINCGGLETRAAVVDNGRLEEYFIERRDEKPLVGSIYKGRICNLEPSLQAAFVDIGQEKNAFLHYWDMLPATQDMLEDDESRAAEEDGEIPAPAETVLDTTADRRPTLLERLKRKLFSHGPEKPASAPPPPPSRHRRPRRSNKPRNTFTVEDIPSLFKVNSDVLVQVTKGPIGNKGPRVTTNLSLPGRYLVLLPNSTHSGISKRIESREERERLRQILRNLDIPANMGVICRTVGAGKSEKAFQSDLAVLKDYWFGGEEARKHKRAPCCVYQEPDLPERILRDYLTEDIDEVVTDSKPTYDFIQQVIKRFTHEDRTKVRFYNNPKPLFYKYALVEQIESIFRRQVSLPGGGYICVDETEALIAIDVNSGKNRAGKDHPETIINTNLEAVAEVTRQLRLRNIGGLIVVDFIDMRGRRDQQNVYRAFKDGLLVDRAKTKVMPISPLGLLEMTRQREHESLQDTVFASCPYCHGKGLIKSATSMSVEIQRKLQEVLRRRRGSTQIRVTVHPDILERLKNEDSDLITDMEREFQGEMSFRADANLHIEEFKIHDAATGDEL